MTTENPPRAQRTDSTFTLSYAVSVPIRAAPARIWSLLTHASAFPSWNSTVTRMQGDIALGQKLAIQVPLAPGRTFRPKVVELVPDTRMVWQDGFFPMFQGTRTFTLSPSSGGGTVFEMTEVFRGLALPMAKGSLPDFTQAFEQYAGDLRRASEKN